MTQLVDFAVVTIFAREVLEGAIIIGQYRTIIMRTDTLPSGATKEEALRAITIAAILASIVAVAVCASVAIPLAVLSNDFDDRTSKVIEGVSKIVAAICILQLSLKFPKWLGVYASKKRPGSEESLAGLSVASIRFNVAWNIWREVAECGVFLIPFFLSGEGVAAIPLSAVIGSVVGLLLGLLIYYANKTLKKKRGLAIFATILLLFVSTGLFTGGCHNLEKVFGKTATVWTLKGNFWSVDRLPMTVLKPFGYSDSRTVLQICCFWLGLLFGIALHLHKWRQSQRIFSQLAAEEEQLNLTDEDDEQQAAPPQDDKDEEALTSSTIETSRESSIEDTPASSLRDELENEGSSDGAFDMEGEEGIEVNDIEQPLPEPIQNTSQDT